MGRVRRIPPKFLSTLSLRRATPGGCWTYQRPLFLSTLSLRRATVWLWRGQQPADDFYPRSPCGERPATRQATFAAAEFLSTLSLRRATSHWVQALPMPPISIHALLAESDSLSGNTGQVPAISIHALLAESDNYVTYKIDAGAVFLSTLSLRRATTSSKPFGRSRLFLSTLSLRRAT